MNLGRFRNLSGVSPAWLLAGLLSILLAIGAWITYNADFQGDDPLDGMEHSLLDMRIRQRAKRMTPSSDIVLVAYDKQTLDYGLSHPELEIQGAEIPRKRQAEIVRFLNRQGARAIVFDLEFSIPKRGDTALLEAISKAKNVYAAFRMEKELGDFKKDQKQRGLIHPESVFYTQALLPYIQSQLYWRTRWLEDSYVSPYEIGVWDLAAILPGMGLQHEAIAGYMANYSLMSGLGQVEKIAVSSTPTQETGSWERRALRSLCKSVYRSYNYNADFLKLLSDKGRFLLFDEPIPPDAEDQVRHCFVWNVEPNILAKLTGLGVTTVSYDNDAFLREIPILYQGYKDKTYFYLGVQVALDLLGVDEVRYHPDYLQVGERKIGLIDGYQVMINWRDPKLLVQQMLQQHQRHLSPSEQTSIRELVDSDSSNLLLGTGHLYRAFPAIDIIRKETGYRVQEDPIQSLYNVYGKQDTGEFSFKDKIVVIGETLHDIHRTPMGRTTYGPEVLMTVIDMFLHDRQFVQIAPLLWSLLLVGLLVVLLVAATLALDNIFAAFSLGIAIVFSYWLFNIWAFVEQGWFFELVRPSIILLAVLFAMLLYRHYIRDREKHHLTRAFSNYVSPQVMGRILENPAHALENLRGGKKELTVLFADLHNFTRQFEFADPEEMVAQLNEYFDVMTEIILKYGGTYDKYMGDAIMAFFGAPSDMPDHAEQACRAALEMEEGLQRLNESWTSRGMQTLTHGVGISSGEMFFGNFGSKNIKNFTVMGSHVNLGARLEAYTRQANWPVLISQNTLNLLKDKARVRAFGMIEVKGFSEPVPIYGLEQVD